MPPAIPTGMNLQPGKMIVVGVSGGPDSLALLYLLQGQKYPLLVASFNHRLRPEAESDIEYVRDIAASLGLAFVAGSGDVTAHAKSHGLSTEESARELRYQFLFDQARQIGAQALAVGHTADDQAETVLMHMLRGAGLSGLKGMPPKIVLPVFDTEIPLVRPLLTWTRAETETYCQQHKLKPRQDPTNTDIQYFRNRLRHELLPILEQYNPQIRQTLAKTAQALQGDYDLINAMVQMTWQNTVISTGPEYIEFDQVKLKKLDPVLTRNLFRKAAFSLRPGLRDVDFEAIERALTFKAVDLAGGIKTYPEGGCFYFTTNEAALPSHAWPQLEKPVKLSPGQYSLGNGWIINFEEITTADHDARVITNNERWTAWLDADLASEGLHMRVYQSGDRFEQLGMPRQTVKIAELFINLKVPRRIRAGWPILCVGEVIAWVPGLRFAEPFKVTDKTSRIYKIEFKKEVDPA